MAKKDLQFNQTKDKDINEPNTRLLAIRKEGHSRVLSMTKILPIEWRFVNIETVKKTDNSVTIKITKTI